MAAPGLRFGMKVQNVDSTLRALRQIDPELRRRVPNEIKSYAQPMLAEIKAGMPKQITSGWSRKGRTGYRYSSARYKTTLQFRGRPPRAGTFVTPNGRRFTVKPGDVWPILRVRSRHLALIIASTAEKGHTNSGKALVNKLNERGKTDRFIWPIVEKHSDDIERGIRDSFRRYEKIVNRQLERR
jgi:hypothetical protein